MSVTDLLYVGRRPEDVVRLPTDAPDEIAVQVTPSLEVAEMKLSRARFDCVLVDDGVYESVHERIRATDPTVPVVVLESSNASSEFRPPDSNDRLLVAAEDDDLSAVVTEATSLPESSNTGLEPGEIPDDFGTLLTASTEADGWAFTVEADGTVVSLTELASGGEYLVEDRQLSNLFGETRATKHIQQGQAALETRRVQTVTGQCQGRLYHTLVRPTDDSRFEIVLTEFGKFDGDGPFTSESTFVDVVLDNLLDIFFVFDLDLNFTFWNERFTEVTGYDPDEIATATPFEFIAEDHHERVVERIGEVVSSGRGTAEFDLVTKDGQRIPYSFTGSMIRSEDGSPLYICGIGRDISERRAREESLRESERALSRERDLIEHILESIPIAICVLDADGAITRTNQRAEGLIGGGAETVDDILAKLSRPPDEAGDDPLLGLFEAGEPVRGVEYLLPGKDEGADRWISANAVPLEMPEAGESRVIVSMDDVTELKERQQELETRRRELERSNADLEQYAYVVSHDLKEPLRMISSYLQLIERRYAEDLDDDGGEFIEYAVDGAERLRRRIRALLRYSQIDQGEIGTDQVDCNEVIESVLENLALSIEEAGAEVAVEELPTVHGDRGQLEKVFQNLVSNAVKYAGVDEPEIHVSAERTNDEWVFAVADDGVGIPVDRQDQVFDLFYTGAADDSTGIGLAICEKIVTRHGGRIWVESAEGEGTTFYFSIPLADADADRLLEGPSPQR